MEFRRYTDIGQEGWEAMWELYQRSFPECELRLLRDQKDAMQDPDFYATGLWDNNTWVGLCFYWYNGKYCYVEHFAVNPELRGRGYGARALEELCKRYALVILEIDLPVDEMSRRRQSFYERSGFQVSGYQHSHPPYRTGDAPHELLALSYPTRLTPELQQEFLSYRKIHVMRYSEPRRLPAR